MNRDLVLNELYKLYGVDNNLSYEEFVQWLGDSKESLIRSLNEKGTKQPLN